MIDICIVIPAYNEEKSISDTIEDYKNFFPKAVLVVVDNNSTDNTYRIVENSFSGTQNILLREIQKGKGRAVKRVLVELMLTYT